MSSRIVRIFTAFVAAMLTVVMTNFSVAQNASTQGTDFWFAFMNNNDGSPTQTCLILSAERACSVIVQNPNTGWQTSVSIPAGGRVDVDIPFAQGYLSGSDGTAYNIGCHLVASDTISAYSMNYKHASFDGGHLLPTSTLSDEYMIETIPPGLNGSSVLLLATENNTIIEVTPSSATGNGWSAGSTQLVTLNAGQAYQFTTSSSTASLSGTRIRTQDCKKIAVFAGGKCAQAPAGCTYCDHIYEPMVPIIYWGSHFAITTSQTRTKDVVRVTALNAGTAVTKNGTVVANLNAGGTYDFEITSSEGSCYIETSGPAVCYLYVTGQSCGGGSGDPSMVYIAPIEQNIKKITFGTYEYTDYTNNHYVNVVTRTDNVASVRLDGTNVSGQFTTLTGNPQYSFARIAISHATHTLQCDSGLVAHVYGLHDVTSYAYSVGSSAVNLTSSMFVNHVNTADLVDNSSTYCANRNIDFEIQLNYPYNNITWYFGDGATSNTNPTVHSYDSDGSFNVMAVVERVGQDNCFGDIFDTLRTVVVIPPPDPIPVYVALCAGGTYDFYGRILDEPGVYLDTIASGGECDSIIELHLSIVPTDPIPIYANICPGETYWFNGRSYNHVGTYMDTVATAAGCDSIVELHLNYSNVPSVNLGSDKVLCSGDEFPVRLGPSVTNGANATYSWSTGETTHSIDVHQAGTYSVTVTNEAGCFGSDDVNIRVQAALTLDIEQTEDFCDKGVTTLIAHTNAPHLQWSTGESASEILIHGYGRYYVRAYDGPCEVSANIDIPRCPFNLYFPNCITATFDDGVNDYFFMSDPSLVSEFEIWIYDRWGMLVYHSTDPHFQWDGTVNGKVATNNEFTWRAFAKPRTEDKKYEFHGSVLVL